MTVERVDRIEDLDLRAYLRAGDTVIWGQACAEPRTLTEALVAQRERLGGIQCFLGIGASETLRPEHADQLSFVGYTAGGTHRALARAGVLDVLPAHYSQLPETFRTRRMPVDVALVSLPPADAGGRYSLGLAAEYLVPALDAARTVIAEVNDQLPRTHTSRTLTDADLDVVLHTSRAPAEIPPAAPTAVEERIAARVAELVDDGATLQAGVGGLPGAVLRRLADRRDLGVHSGLVVDAVVDLVEAGAVTGARKSRDPGVVVGGVLMGSQRLFRFADRNPGVLLRETGYIHDPEVLAAQERFVAINSAVEVDLTGQVNAEVAGGRYVGAVGGAVDFLRGAHRSRGGVPIVALPATAGAGSRIVSRLSGPVSTSRADAGVIVTEFGVADLRGLPLRERRARMLALADPEHRPALEADIDASGEPVALSGRKGA